jgi:hypothetical protein
MLSRSNTAISMVFSLDLIKSQRAFNIADSFFSGVVKNILISEENSAFENNIVKNKTNDLI